MLSTNTIVINLVGGPGCGKSTAAAGLYSELKKLGLQVVFIERTDRENNYIKYFADDLNNIYKYVGGVDVIIHEGSLLDHIVYNTKENNQIFNTLVLQEYNKFRNLDFFVNRGELHSDYMNPDQEEDLDKRIIATYEYANIGLIHINASTAIENILNYVGNIGKE